MFERVKPGGAWAGSPVDDGWPDGGWSDDAWPDGGWSDDAWPDGGWSDDAWPDGGWSDDAAREAPEWLPALAEWGPPARQPSGPDPGSAPSGWLAVELDQHTAGPGGLSDAELIDGMVGFERVVSWAQARQARLLAEFARRRPADDPRASRSTATSPFSEFAPDEVGLALRLSRTTASARTAHACTLVEELPATLTAWEQGLLDAPKVRAVTDAACALPADLRPALEARVLPRAADQTVAQLRAALGRAVLAVDPEGARSRHQQRRAERRVVVTPEGDGMASLWALLPAPEATAAYQRLNQLARGLGAGDPRGMDARRADLLTEILAGARCAATAAVPDTPAATASSVPVSSAPVSSVLASTVTSSAVSASTRAVNSTASGGLPAAGRHQCRPAGPGRPLVHVTVPVTMLLGLDDQPGELAGHGPIPAAQARAIAAEGIWRRLLTDPATGTLLEHGRTTYVPPAGLADFVRARDVHCRFPTCRQPAARADLDHAVPYDGGGSTTTSNLHASCRHHHRAKTHMPGWSVTQHHDGQITYTTPTGHRYTSEPHDYRPEPVPEQPPRSRPIENTGREPAERDRMALVRAPA